MYLYAYLHTMYMCVDVPENTLIIFEHIYIYADQLAADLLAPPKGATAADSVQLALTMLQAAGAERFPSWHAFQSWRSGWDGLLQEVTLAQACWLSSQGKAQPPSMLPAQPTHSRLSL